MRLRNQLKSFIKDREGTIIVEMVLVTPLLALALYTAYVFFDAYRIRNTAQKATYTVSDLLSRQTAAVDEAYLEGIKNIFDYLAKTDPVDTGLRITSMTYDKEQAATFVQWSHAMGNVEIELTDQDLIDLEDRIPQIADDDTLILVESFISYEPPMKRVIPSQNFKTFTPVSPRFAPKLAWDGL